GAAKGVEERDGLVHLGPASTDEARPDALGIGRSYAGERGGGEGGFFGRPLGQAELGHQAHAGLVDVVEGEAVEAAQTGDVVAAQLHRPVDEVAAVQVRLDDEG